MIYQRFQLTKQAVHQYEDRQFRRHLYHQDLLEEVKMQRRLHPRMGAKVLYAVLKPERIGRIAFERLVRENGYNLRRVRSCFKTTDSSWVRYKNLIAGMQLNDINQVWVSDLTYYMLKDHQVCYITTLMDLYSRRIIGYSASQTMLSQESSMKCIQMAFKSRGTKQFNLIHHSDRGSQYRFKKYINLIEKAGARVSMCRSVYDNPHMERLNGTVKNDYLIPLGVDTFSELKQQLTTIVNRYNTLRPHSKLEGLTPIAFEQVIIKTPIEKRPYTQIKNEIFAIHKN